ncbi:helix-turn-helix transcriptional regulator [Sphingomonadales bacterium 56]|uniref:TetR/AcrR family transcriptional regulator n=1 Tax=unclassified Sphingobium TaxID=2611147 RepID=UPI00191B8B67|nr:MULTISPECIES: TetR/AcrR family transcriptional regulator [unclassified Sphingobium]MBY2930178.1 helix-turn-helix transcriptional regulator [Sphingomonadales bacterium 56]MBY2959937.1 helix-turn-helix transcriptional regulator [Sphingomonadales bacterium 58]CAD7339982.1 HTH-type transcriptional regulator BetI [Sphingobium sp. S8]CAD7340873.1 HTH-type transcriptional regulator BetI [Sphingobium sp. S6]
MPATRLSSAGRRASIIAAARAVFARHGLEGARTQQIARAAGVSEALLFRHFPTKTHLYRAVLREVITDQNIVMRSFGEAEASSEGLLEILRRTFSYAMAGMHAVNAEGLRMVVGSLAGDGGYARLVYRRALRMTLPNLERAIEAARADGGIAGETLSVTNAGAYVEHVSTMMMMARCHDKVAIPYDEDRALRDAILFCARGLGVDEGRILKFLKQMKPNEPGDASFVKPAASVAPSNAG